MSLPSFFYYKNDTTMKRLFFLLIVLITIPQASLMAKSTEQLNNFFSVSDYYFRNMYIMGWSITSMPVET